jgi:glycerate kinase
VAATRILVAPDKFAGTLSAAAAAAAIARGWRRQSPDATCDLAPLADGGPGFVRTMHAALGGEIRKCKTTGPTGAPVVAEWLWTPQTAYVEAAEAAGLHLTTSPRDALAATSSGLAAVLSAAAQSGVGSVVVGVGGTGSTDGGRDLVQRLRTWPAAVELVVATDVDNPLLGPEGAAAVFGPQKGADDAQVQVLEERLAAWAAECGLDPALPGAGAGGGLGYGLMALGARRVSGAQAVLDAVLPPDRMAAADLVITGEGSFDFQSLRGKLASAVAGRAQGAGVPCLVLAGRVTVGRREAAAAGIEACYAMVDRFGSEDALTNAEARLADLAAEVAGTWGR